MSDGRSLELLNEPSYTFGSVDNPRSYEHEYRLCGDGTPMSKHGVRCLGASGVDASAIVGASGGGTGIHENSAVLEGERCFLGVGDQLACLSLPELLLLWHLQGDGATCFGVYRAPEGRCVIVHGELEVSAVTLEGERLWAFAGRDIFTGPFRVSGNQVFATDWDGQLYCLDVVTGALVEPAG